MARDFEAAGSDQFFEVDSTLITDYPFSVSAWIKPENITGNGSIFFVGDKDVTNNFHSFFYTSDNRIWVASRNTTEQGANIQNVGVVANGVEFFACAVWASATSRTIYLNGSASTASNTNSVTFTGADRTSIGRYADSTPGRYMDGLISEMGVWNVELTTSDVDMLANRFSPLMVKPSGLLHYYPLIGNNSPEIDFVSGLNLTMNGTVAKASHPRIIYPSASQMRRFGSAVAPSTSVKDFIGSGFIPFAR